MPHLPRKASLKCNYLSFVSSFTYRLLDNWLSWVHLSWGKQYNKAQARIISKIPEIGEQGKRVGGRIRRTFLPHPTTTTQIPQYPLIRWSDVIQHLEMAVRKKFLLNRKKTLAKQNTKINYTQEWQINIREWKEKSEGLEKKCSVHHGKSQLPASIEA